MFRELFIWFPFAWSPPVVLSGIWFLVAQVGQMTDREVEETDIFRYRFLNGQVQLVKVVFVSLRDVFHRAESVVTRLRR